MFINWSEIARSTDDLLKIKIIAANLESSEGKEIIKEYSRFFIEKEELKPTKLSKILSHKKEFLEKTHSGAAYFLEVGLDEKIPVIGFNYPPCKCENPGESILDLTLPDEFDVRINTGDIVTIDEAKLFVLANYHLLSEIYFAPVKLIEIDCKISDEFLNPHILK